MLLIPLILALAFTLTPLSSAKEMDHKPFQPQEVAEHVLIGTVKNIESRWNDDGTSIYSYVTVSVESWLTQSRYDKEITIKYVGGEVDGLGSWVSNQPDFSIGERVKVFLMLAETGEWAVVGGRQGKISLSNSASLGYSYSGRHWHSNSLPVKYYINELGTPDTTDEFTAVQSAFQTWEDDPGSFMDYTYMGTTNKSGDHLDDYNTVSWVYINDPIHPAYCRIWWYTYSKELVEFDMVFDEAYTWSLPQYDVQNVATHEAGHTLNLNDLYDSANSEETMYGITSPGETKKSTLNAGDIAGIRHIYPGSMVTYTITTNPIGLQVEVDGNSSTSPRSFSWYPSATHIIRAPSPQSGGTGVRYLYASWSDGGAQTHTITVWASDNTISASYRTQYYFTVSSSHGSPLPLSGWFNAGDPITASVTSPSSGPTGTRYVCIGWTGTGSAPASGTGTTATFSINAPSNITWNWKTQYYLTVTSPRGSPTPTSGWFDSGIPINASVTSPVPSTAVTQYVCTGWTGTGSVPSSGSATLVFFNILAPSSITWNWRTQYFLTVSSPYGTTGGQGWYDSGDTAYATVTPLTVPGSSGVQYVFTRWSGGASGTTSPSNPILMSGPKTANGNWKTQYYLTVNSLYGVASGAGWYDSGSTVYTRLNVGITSGGAGTRCLFTSWGGDASGTNYAGSNPITMNAQKTATANWKTQHQLSFRFMTNSSQEIRPTQIKILGSSPNNTLITLTSYSNMWLDSVEWTARQILWMGNNVVPDPNPNYSLTAPATWTIHCRVYIIAFVGSFKDSHGVPLYTNPSSFKLACPNGTTTLSLPVSSYYLQNGTFQWTSIVWQGIDVMPSPALTFDSIHDSPTINCRVYPLTVYVRDYLALAVSGADVSLYLPDGTLLTYGKSGAGGEIAFSQLPASDYKVETAFLGFRTSAALSLASDKTVEMKLFLSIPTAAIITLVASISIGVILWKFLKKPKRIHHESLKPSTT